jgi:hypothetical protein
MLDIIHRPDFYLKHKASETGFCLRLQIEPTQLCPIDSASLCGGVRRERVGLRVALSIWPNWAGST